MRILRKMKIANDFLDHLPVFCNFKAVIEGDGGQIAGVETQRSRGDEERDMRVYYDRDCDVNLIKDKKVAILGYGSRDMRTR
jgi:hypothetical protein